MNQAKGKLKRIKCLLLIRMMTSLLSAEHDANIVCKPSFTTKYSGANDKPVTGKS